VFAGYVTKKPTAGAAGFFIRIRINTARKNGFSQKPLDKI
jgi:hypothetical protein